MNHDAFLEFLVPPLPYYIENGEDTYEKGQSHISRRNLGVFDLIAVTEGRLFLGEDNYQWVVNPGETLIFRPDCYHYATQPCLEKTHFYWMHFQTAGAWLCSEVKNHVQKYDHNVRQRHEKAIHLNKNRHFRLPGIFTLKLPQHMTLPVPDETFKNFLDLAELERKSPFSARWEQQMIFQNILRNLHKNHETEQDPASVQLANAATSLLRKDYQLPFSYDRIGEQLHFHPTYIARCVKKVYGCTLLDYLIRYRLKKAKSLLISTNLKVSVVAEKVGFQNPVYFTRRFKQSEGLSPQQFRKHYRASAER